MDTGLDLSVDFHSQEPEGPECSPEDLTPFSHHGEQPRADAGRVIEMIDRLPPPDIDVARNAGAAGAPELSEPHLGMEFGLLESARDFYIAYGERLGFRVRASRLRTSRCDSSIVMRRFVCYKEGFCAKKEKKNAAKERRRRGSIREGCKAMFEVAKNGGGRWVVTKLVTEHTHPFSSAIKARGPKREKAVPNLNSSAGGGVATRRRFSWRGGEALDLLEYLKEMQARNPAFFYAVQVDDRSNRLANVLWADARARAAYSYFGDTVTLDTSFRKNKHMMPFVTFTGTNHHLQPVVFACGILVQESEASFIWLFESFLISMCGKHPVSFVTEHTEALGLAVGKVFPRTKHRYGKWQLLSKCREKLPKVCSNPTKKRCFKRELRMCVDDPKTAEEFQLTWEAILHEYNLQENDWMQSLYRDRQQWAKMYLKDTFFAEMSPIQRSESMKKFFQRNFEKKTALGEFIRKFDQAMLGQYEKEVQADFANMSTRPVLLTGLPIEKQVADVYTKTILSIFQEELVQSSSYSCSLDKEDGVVLKYRVLLGGQNAGTVETVSFNYVDKATRCSCSKFEFSGIICRHILRVYADVNVSKIPEEYILRRWKKVAKSGPVFFESFLHAQISHQNNLMTRSNSLCLDVLKYAAECGTSLEMYNAAKMALQQAHAEVLAAKKLCAS